MDLAGEDRDLIGRIGMKKGTCPYPFPLPDQTAYPTNAASAEAGPAPRGTLVKAPSAKRTLWERSVRSGNRSQCGQPAPSRADFACFTPKQTRTDCVYPLDDLLLLHYS